MTRKRLFDFLHKNGWITILLILSVTGITLSICGFCEQGHSCSESLYRTFQLFFLNILFGENGIEISRLLQWARWLIFVSVIWATFRLFFEILAPKWWQSTKQYFPCSKRYLFVGAGEQAKILARNLQENHCRCIFLVSKEKENDNALYDKLRDIGAILHDDTVLNILAENEHLRWNAFHFVNGICKWKLNEIDKKNAKLIDKDGNLLKHGCLVEFSELGDISAKVRQLGNTNEDYAESDRRIVRHFPLFVKEKELLKNKNQ